ncbi:hypothetical protein PIB30_089029, partial [Stylosanthes scabra]|nr:hypothetical protein [Stylosanthes scabra]
MEKDKEGIGSKGFMKRSKKGGFWILQVASEVASEAAHATLEQGAVLTLSRQSCVRNFNTCVRNFLPEAFFELSETENSEPVARAAAGCSSLTFYIGRIDMAKGRSRATDKGGADKSRVAATGEGAD